MTVDTYLKNHLFFDNKDEEKPVYRFKDEEHVITITLLDLESSTKIKAYHQKGRNYLYYTTTWSYHPNATKEWTDQGDNLTHFPPWFSSIISNIKKHYDKRDRTRRIVC